MMLTMSITGPKASLNCDLCFEMFSPALACGEERALFHQTPSPWALSSYLGTI